MSDVREMAFGHIEKAVETLDVANKSDAGGDRLMWAVGSAIALAICGLACAVLSQGTKAA